MYAVIESGGKQYRVEVGTELEVDLLDAQPGQALTIERVLLVGDGDETAIGRPLVANATVEAEVVRRDRGPKLIVFKYRPKARRRVKKGHRQDHMVLRITDVKLGSKSAAASVRKAEQAEKSERQKLQEAAARQAAEDAALAEKLAKTKTAPKAERAPAKPATKASATKASAIKAEPKTTAKAKAAPAKSATKPKTAPADKAPARKATAKAAPTSKTRSAGAARDAKPARDTKAAPKRSRTKKDE